MDTKNLIRMSDSSIPPFLDLGQGFDQFLNCVSSLSLSYGTSVLMPMPEADVYRSIFKFGVFNAVQSSCFDNVSSI